MIPLIDWGQRTSALPDAFDASAEMFEGNVQTQSGLLETLLLLATCGWIVYEAGHRLLIAEHVVVHANV